MEIYDAAADRWNFGPPCIGGLERGCAVASEGELHRFADRGCWTYTPSPVEPTVLRRVEMAGLSDCAIGDVVDVDGTRGRIIGFHRDWKKNPHRTRPGLPDDIEDDGVNAVDVLVTENDEPYAAWLMTWWSEAYRFSEATTTLATCVAAADKILVFGGDSELHSQGDWQYHEDLLADFEDNDQSFLEDLKPKFDNESIDHMYPLGQAGPWFPDELEPATWQRSMDQSEEAAATVVHM